LILSGSSFTPFASLSRRNIDSVFAVRGEYAVKAGEVDPRRGYQGRQAGQEVEWFDKIAGSDFEQPQAGPKGGGQDARSNITWVVPSR
jgi:hypothetical protein